MLLILLFFVIYLFIYLFTLQMLLPAPFLSTLQLYHMLYLIPTLCLQENVCLPFLQLDLPTPWVLKSP